MGSPGLMRKSGLTSFESTLIIGSVNIIEQQTNNEVYDSVVNVQYYKPMGGGLAKKVY
jgi:hypothetical protein